MKPDVYKALMKDLHPEAQTKVLETMVKKLALWNTRMFSPILTHNELEPIMASAGFMPFAMESAPQSPVAWRKYAYCSAPSCDGLPTPRLPFPCIDGAHIIAYRTFLQDVEYYLGEEETSKLFHVRSMPLENKHMLKLYEPMKGYNMGHEEIYYIYRRGTLVDDTTRTPRHTSNEDGSSNIAHMSHTNSLIRQHKYNDNDSDPISMVPLSKMIEKNGTVAKLVNGEHKIYPTCNDFNY